MKRIAHITDPHLDEAFPKENGVDAHKNWNTVLNDLIKRNIDEVICTGDIGEDSSIAGFLKSLSNSGFAPKITLGNHDTYDEVMAHYDNSLNQGTNELYYSVKEDTYKYIFLDSSPDEVSQVQIEWLKKELNTELKILLFIHHPILDCRTILDRKFPLKNRDQLKEVLQSCSQEIMMFCGHYHMNDERNEANIHQHITPAISYQVGKFEDRIELNTENFGYRIIEIDETSISTEVIMFSSDNY
jgi:3',5'-cyclic AMP phosphodiesterase CpdA